MANNTFLLANRRWPGTRPWAIESEAGDAFPGSTYIARALAILDDLLGSQGVTFVATDDLRHIPVRGRHVVAVVHEDEWCRVPAYAGAVRAVFKTYGTSLKWAANPLRSPSLDALLSSIQDGRTEIARSASRFRKGKRSVFAIPLGYYRQLDRAPLPIRDRRFDLYFGGSVRSTRAVRNNVFAALGTPKNRSRRVLLEQMENLRAERPTIRIASHLTRSFQDVATHEVDAYSDAMLATKICVVPRGQNLETYRFFEGLRSGCAVITEALPSRWFYDGAPVKRVASWRHLESVVLKLLGDPALLERRHQESLAWWRDVCSERALALFMQRSLETCGR